MIIKHAKNLVVNVNMIEINGDCRAQMEEWSTKMENQLEKHKKNQLKKLIKK